ncbi:DUF1345 domain-containing protein [Hymenobacter sp. RP-2-7]|uniref:DUF1345 domain-containing protein n=1 Tax=Hymenobacter polaris TaxID=2682546 RepID=A0A7Y0AG89_9BACT|nr:DUF1345 domain-containing protein [Hymenobacter polaris]NML66790.1 DUF1345 domain-containing protein [Hymenobacter polaris]
MSVTSNPKPVSFLGRVGRLPTAIRLLLALGAGVAAGCFSHHSLLVRLVSGWDAFALVTLALVWISIYQADIDRIREVAAQEDFSRTVATLFILVAASASLLAVVALLSTLHNLDGAAQARRLGLLVVAVGSSWLLVHTVFTLRYAHEYYDQDQPGQDNGGLDFPGDEKEPDYLDVAYFAFVIGMTAQTADVEISGRKLRRLALVHCLISFGFNTALVALVINGVAGAL